MSNFEVKVLPVQLFPHNNADSLDLVKMEDFQYVVQKGIYEQGDLALSIPKRAIVTGAIKDEYIKYLRVLKSGVCVVGEIVLRGQMSQGILISKELASSVGIDLDSLPLGVDVSEQLGITKYVAPIPEDLKDKVEIIEMDLVKDHDCKYPILLADKFAIGEPVTITEKLHGMQLIIVIKEDTLYYTTKSLFDKEMYFKQGLDSYIVQAIQRIDGLDAFLDKSISDGVTYQFVGELVGPGVHPSFSYGLTKPTFFLYKYLIDGVPHNLSYLGDIFTQVPLIDTVAWSEDLCKELETIYSKRNESFLHPETLMEGVVVSNNKHFIKIKNAKFLKKHEDTSEGLEE